MLNFEKFHWKVILPFWRWITNKKSVYTREQRLKIYSYLLDYYLKLTHEIHPVLDYHAMCYMVNVYVHSNNMDSLRPLKYNLPELTAQTPSRNFGLDTGYWWPKNNEGIEHRMEALCKSIQLIL